MTQEAVINVRLDTKQAKDALKELDKDAEASARKQGEGLRGRLGRGVKATALGAVGGVVGATGVRAAAGSGVGSYFTEGLGDIGAKIDARFDGPLNRANERARQSAAEAYGILGPGAANAAEDYFRAQRRLFLQEELGRSEIMRSENLRQEGTLIRQIRDILSIAGRPIVDAVRDVSPGRGGNR